MDYDNNPVSVMAKCSYDEYREYFMFSLFRATRFLFSKRMLSFPILIILTTTLAIISHYNTFVVFCDVALILIYVFFIFVISYFPRKNFKIIEKLYSSGIFFEFRNNDFSVNQSNDLYTGEGKMKYEVIYKVYETETMFYIYTAPGQAFFINKDNITEENSNSLRTILQNKINKKKFVKYF